MDRFTKLIYTENKHVSIGMASQFLKPTLTCGFAFLAIKESAPKRNHMLY